MALASIAFNTAEAERQIAGFMALVDSRFPDGIPDSLIGEFPKLSLDLILTDFRSTTGTDGFVHIVQGFRLGDSFENLRAAVLAGEFDIHRA